MALHPKGPVASTDPLSPSDSQPPSLTTALTKALTTTPTTALTTAAGTAAGPHGAAQGRLYFLDWLRIGAFLLLVVYHVGMYYVSWPFHFKSAQIVPALEPFMRMSSPWRMSLLFLISGAASHFLFSSAVAPRLRDRARRLLLPLLAGVFLVVPPQSYFEAMQRFGFSGGYVEFMGLYLSVFGGFCDARGCLILPTWNHLWFLPYLFCYTALLWWLMRIHPRGLAVLGLRLDADLRGWRLLLLPMLFLILVRLLLAGRFPVTGALVDDWFSHAQYAGMFLFGALLARNGRLWVRMTEWRWPALLLAVLGWVVFAGLSQPADGATVPALSAFPMLGGKVVRGIAASVQQWSAIMALLGFGRRWLDFDHPVRAYLTQVVFPVYLVHQTLIILLAVVMASIGLPWFYEAPLLIGLTLAGSLVLAEVARRIPVLQVWVGHSPVRGDSPGPAIAASSMSR